MQTIRRSSHRLPVGVINYFRVAELSADQAQSSRARFEVVIKSGGALYNSKGEKVSMQPASPQPPVPQYTPQAPPPDWNKLLDDAEFRKAAAKLLGGVDGILGKVIDGRERATSRLTWVTIGLTVFIVLAIIIPVSVLTYDGKMPSDAATFVFGVLVGAVFTVLGDFIPRRE